MSTDLTLGGATAKGDERVLLTDDAGSALVRNVTGRYSVEAELGILFGAANQVAVTTTIGLATTYQGLCLQNPLGSGKKMWLRAAGFALSVAPVAISTLHLIGGWTAGTDVAHTTPVTGYCTKLGAAGPIGLTDAAATIPTPKYLLPLFGGYTAGSLPSPVMSLVDLGDMIHLQPGAFVAIGSSTVVIGFGCFIWTEVPA